MRRSFAKKMIEVAEKDDKLIVLIGDISHYLLKDFEERFPNRFYNVGICEQSMVGMAAGLAMEGYRPVIHTIAPFCVERAYEQIKVDLCYQNVDVTIVSVGGSFDYAHLGCTHHCYSDVAILRPLPNIEIFCPGNSKEFGTLFENSWSNGKPKYFKLIKDEHKKNLDILPYECYIMNKGNLNNPIIFTSGHLLDLATNVLDHTVVYCPTIEPISLASQMKIQNLLKKQNKCVTIEENSSIGSLGDKIFDIASASQVPITMKKIGIPRKFSLNYGKASDHRKEIGITIESLLESVREL